MIRLFVAIDLPEWIKTELSTLCAFGLRGVKWVDPKQFHLSLRFIGEVDNALFRDIADSLTKIKGKPFPLSLSQVGTFPQSKTPRVIWTGIDKNEELNILQKKVELQLNRLQIKGEKRKFSPHITLGRVISHPPGHIGEFLVQNNLYQSEPFEVDRFFLYSSILTPKGAIHHREKEYEL